MNMPTVPEFAIIGHPNEGKSSVLSTLAEDDSVRVSPIPGETVLCQPFPVRIDGREIIRFIDTPGFQNPRQTLQWLQDYQGPEDRLLTAFIEAHRDDPAFRDDCELLRPVAAGAGVIFVVDGSRPLRHVDRAEMEILRLTGAQRMAVINCKEEEFAALPQWQSEFRKHFNSVRLFNSCRANYRQRIELLESLKAIDQRLEPVLRSVIEAFQADWEGRNIEAAAILAAMLRDILGYRRAVSCPPGEEEVRRQALRREYEAYVVDAERSARQAIRRLYKHNIFNLELPPHSILAEDLFSRQTWEFLGLSDRQLIVAGALGGAALAAGIDAATLGASFGLFSAIGGLIGAGATALKGRALLFYGHVINWAHGRRDYERVQEAAPTENGRGGFASRWPAERRRVCERFFRAVQKGHEGEIEETSAALQALLRDQFQELAEDRDAAGADLLPAVTCGPDSAAP
jgi:hypothetical protein